MIQVVDHRTNGSLLGACRKSYLSANALPLPQSLQQKVQQLAGTAIRGSVELLRGKGCDVIGVVVAADREEKGAGGELPAVMQVEQDLGLKVPILLGDRYIFVYLVDLSR